MADSYTHVFPLDEGDVVLGFFTVRRRANGSLLLLGHSVPGQELPSDTPEILRALAGELDIRRFRQQMDDADV